MAVGRSAALKLDWTKLGQQLGLRGNTAAALQSFKKRNDDARRKVTVLSEQPQTVDFAYYRSVLKNQAIVDDIEKQFNAYKPQTYDVNRQIKAIEAFEAQAVKSAEETKAVVDKELSDLQKTLKNIEEARPFADLTVDEVAAAQPEIDQRTEQLVSKGRWAVPGYKASLRAVLRTFRGFANNRTGEVRRSFRLVNVSFSIAKFYPTWVVSPTYCE
ncbi:ATP synthase d subunit [Curvularia kusanoi]|uniref:ATP synthase subunit d, mitochondrial n=1 Tax=Curvularia kusanoi TaxID=90978 RepID=A0A9P4WC49_CURKU|nr:ATP synthase d subunit [Curvularia kusanoi]